MEGLHSIALAVAHLESLQQPDVPASAAPPMITSSGWEPTASPCLIPKSTPFSSTMRVVTLDESLAGADSSMPPMIAETTLSETLVSATPVVPEEGRVAGTDLHDSDLGGFEAGGKSTNPTSAPIKNLQAFFTIDPESAAAATSRCPPAPGPADVIASVLHDDVLCGRGGETNHHPGNVQYRQLVKWCQPAYLEAKRRDKPRIAAGIVTAVRRIGGRFLKRDPNSNTWRDVGNRRAREKTSQALREGAPELRNGPQQPSDLAPADRDKHKKASNNTKVSDDSSGTSGSITGQLRLSSIPVVIEASSVLHVQGGTVKNEEPSPKKRRVTSSLDGVKMPIVSPVPHIPAVMPYPQQQASLSKGVVATISGDDADEEEREVDAELGGRPNQGRHGPRIKLLKRRLEYETS